MTVHNGQRLHFTKKVLESIATPTAGRTVLHDSAQRGLGLRVEPTGRKSFFWLKKCQGRARFKLIGVFPDTSIEQARGAASEQNAKAAEWKRRGYQGDDPFADHSPDHLTLGELVEKYVERLVRKKANNPAKAEKDVRWMVGKYLSNWRTRRLGAITRKDVRELHDAIGRDHGPVSADRVVQLIRRLFFWAGSRNVELFSGENPATRIQFNGHDKRARFLQPGELGRLFAALADEPSRDLQDFVGLALATGARKSNVLAMQWKELTEQGDLWNWTIEKTKTGKTYVLPLTPAAVKILDGRRHLQPSSSWVFPSSSSASGHLEEPKRQWRRLLRRAKIEDFCIHDLRRTNASYQAIAGVSLQAIAATLGHASVSSTEIYARLNNDVARAALVSGDAMMQASMLTAAKKQQKQIGSGAAHARP